MADTVWIQERVARTRAMIVATETALEAIQSGAQSYSLDTGQTRQTVTKANVAELRGNLKYYEERLTELEAQLTTAVSGPASAYVRPAF